MNTKFFCIKLTNYGAYMHACMRTYVSTCIHTYSHIHAMLPPQAADYTNSLMWYNYSLSLFSAEEADNNLAKLQVTDLLAMYCVSVDRVY